MAMRDGAREGKEALHQALLLMPGCKGAEGNLTSPLHTLHQTCHRRCRAGCTHDTHMLGQAARHHRTGKGCRQADGVRHCALQRGRELCAPQQHILAHKQAHETAAMQLKRLVDELRPCGGRGLGKVQHTGRCIRAEEGGQIQGLKRQGDRIGSRHAQAGRAQLCPEGGTAGQCAHMRGACVQGAGQGQGEWEGGDRPHCAPPRTGGAHCACRLVQACGSTVGQGRASNSGATHGRV
mmetsp:Transcript_37242/g.93510  ORF Transcript_37242/g.93510 Transcript_37242/m.93510 type:complete len:237 (+) Transcript_37242:601-1311(+)